jgi:hypothetical protein
MATSKKKYSVFVLQSDMKKKLQKSFSSIILNALVNNSKKTLGSLANTINNHINKVTFGDWNVIVGKNFCNAIHYKRKYFYYGKSLKGGANDLEFMVYRCGPKETTSKENSNVGNNNNANEKIHEKNNIASGDGQMNIEIDSGIFDRTKVVPMDHQMTRSMMKTITNVFRLSLSQKDTPSNNVDLLHTLSSKFIRSRLSLLFKENDGHWQVIVGDATALEGSVNYFENCYAVLRAGNHKAIIFSHADNHVPKLTTNEKLTKLFYFLATAAFITFLIMQNFMRNEVCEIKQNSNNDDTQLESNACTKLDIENALFLGYCIDKIPIVIVTLLLGATSIRIVNTMYNR